jgi:hypothetical protein
VFGVLSADGKRAKEDETVGGVAKKQGQLNTTAGEITIVPSNASVLQLESN